MKRLSGRRQSIAKYFETFAFTTFCFCLTSSNALATRKGEASDHLSNSQELQTNRQRQFDNKVKEMEGRKAGEMTEMSGDRDNHSQQAVNTMARKYLNSNSFGQFLKGLHEKQSDLNISIKESEETAKNIQNNQSDWKELRDSESVAIRIVSDLDGFNKLHQQRTRCVATYEELKNTANNYPVHAGFAQASRDEYGRTVPKRLTGFRVTQDNKTGALSVSEDRNARPFREAYLTTVEQEGLTNNQVLENLKSLKLPDNFSTQPSLIFETNWKNAFAGIVQSPKNYLPRIQFSDEKYNQVKKSFDEFVSSQIYSRGKHASLAGLLTLSGVWSGQIAAEAETLVATTGLSENVVFEAMWLGMNELNENVKLAVLEELYQINPASRFYRFAKEKINQNLEELGFRNIYIEIQNAFESRNLAALPDLIEAFIKYRSDGPSPHSAVVSKEIFEANRFLQLSQREQNAYIEMQEKLFERSSQILSTYKNSELFKATLPLAADPSQLDTLFHLASKFPPNDRFASMKTLLDRLSRSVSEEQEFRHQISQVFTRELEANSNLEDLRSLAEADSEKRKIVALAVSIRREMMNQKDFGLSDPGKALLNQLNHFYKERNRRLIKTIDKFNNISSLMAGSKAGDELQLRIQLAALRLKIDGDWEAALTSIESLRDPVTGKYPSLDLGSFQTIFEPMKQLIAQVVEAGDARPHLVQEFTLGLNAVKQVHLDPAMLSLDPTTIDQDPKTAVIRNALTEFKTLMNALEKNKEALPRNWRAQMTSRLLEITKGLSEAAKDHPEEVFKSTNIDSIISELNRHPLGAVK